ncbi:MAG: hypothetical protein ACTSQP_23225, partial [Promethearchaeota archaeon]
VSFDVIEHLSNPNKMLLEIKRVCRNEGRVIIGTPIRYSEKVSSKSHYHEYFPQEFEELLKKYFDRVKIIQTHNLVYFLLYNFNFILFKKRIKVFRYIINFITLFLKKNPFLYKNNDKNTLYSYMFGIATVNK